MRERRRTPRIPVQWEVTVIDGAGWRWQGTAIDVSPLGMGVKLTEPLHPHRFLLLSFTPPDGKGPLWVDVAIARQGAEGVYGLQFLNLSSVAAQRLGSLLGLEGVPERARPPRPTRKRSPRRQ